MIVRADALRIPLAERSVDLVIGSPPYLDARHYGDARRHSRNLNDWVAWMLVVTAESLRVSRGLVVWVCAGVTRDRTYQPGPEALLADAIRYGLPTGQYVDGIELRHRCSAYRPVYWHRVGIPGSGHDDWFRADMEYCLAFKRPGKLPWADNTANGHTPKYTSGGAMSHRLSDGTRVNQWGKTGSMTGTTTGSKEKPTIGKPRPSHRLDLGNEKGSAAVLPAIANPGNLLHTNVGGGQMGSALAHESEAPYPQSLPAWFLRSH
jgi:hypothetical protein